EPQLATIAENSGEQLAFAEPKHARDEELEYANEPQRRFNIHMPDTRKEPVFSQEPIAEDRTPVTPAQDVAPVKQEPVYVEPQPEPQPYPVPSYDVQESVERSALLGATIEELEAAAQYEEFDGPASRRTVKSKPECLPRYRNR
ncbi:hypothetical protein AKJ18_22905, partial [Vibrio xuii]